MNPRFRLLGTMTAEGPGGPIDLGGPKQRAVLALLLLNANRPLTTDQMIEGLWGDQAPNRASATLQAYISNLRRLLDPDRAVRSLDGVLERTGGGYQMSLATGDLDILEFEMLLERGSEVVTVDPEAGRAILAEALALWRGPALADFRFDAFAMAASDRLEGRRLDALERRIGADLVLGKSGELVAEIESLVAEHPLREGLWHSLMLALYRSGRQADALRAFQRCSSTLGEEIGISPSEALRQLESAILDQDPSLDAPRKRARSKSGPAPGTLVGRDRERRRFAELIDQAFDGHGRMVLIDGESGIGKTALLEQLERDAAEAGLRTALARCVEVGGTPPFWPLSQIVRRLGADAVLSAAGHYGPYLRPLLPMDADQMASEPQSYRVAEGLTAALGAMSAAEPLALFVDDLFGADPDSLAALTMLAAEMESLPLVIVATHRGDGLDADHPLTPAIAQMVRFSWVEQMPVEPMTLDEMAHVVNRRVDEPLDEATVATVHERSGGNPFYAVELSRLLATGEGHSPSEAVPSTVMKVVERRLDGLSHQTRLLIRTAATCGREFELQIVTAATDLDPEAAVAAVEEAVQAAFVQEAEAVGRYRFSHLIVVNSLSRSLSAIRRAHTNRRLADAIEYHYGDDPERWTQIAHHRCQAIPVAGPGRAIDALARAGAEAVAVQAFESAEELLEQRHDLVLGVPAGPYRDRAELASLIDLGRVWSWHDGYSSQRLRQASDRMMELAGGHADGSADHAATAIDHNAPTSTEQALAALYARFSLELVAGDHLAASRIVDRLGALSEQCNEPPVTFAFQMASAMHHTLTGLAVDAVDAVARAGIALDVLEPRGDGGVKMPLGEISARVTHRGFAGWAAWLAGDRDRAQAELTECRALCDQSADAFARFFCVTVEGRVAAMDGSPDWVQDVLGWGATPTEDVLVDVNRVWPALLRAWVDGRLGGDPRHAAAELTAGLGSLEQIGALNGHTLYWGLAADLLLLADDPAEALQAARRGIRRADLSGERFWYPELQRLTAQACRRLDNIEESDISHRAGLDAARLLGIVPLHDRLIADRPPMALVR